MNEWLNLFKRTIDSEFKDRVEFIGLQGSHAREEADHGSDIDVVVILDKLSYDDLKRYDEVVTKLPEREKICGFISGKDELLNWDRGDLFQFCHDTVSLKGNLKFVEEKISIDDVKRAVHIGACNIYHMCVHNIVHEKSAEITKGLLKSSRFVLQAKHYLDTGTYLKKKTDLYEALGGRDREVMRMFMISDNCEMRFDESSDVLLEWAKEIIVSYGSDKLLKNCIEAVNVEFVPVDKCDGEMITELSGFAGRIVKEHFDKIIDPAQNDYMIDKFQSVDAITDQIKSGYRYYIVKLADGDKAGFLAFYPKGGMMYLSKFYTAAEHRGKHLARRMLAFIADETKRENLSAIFLNVNRNNSDVISIYEHLGFKITGEEKNDIGGGFVMDDYVMTYLV